MDNRDLLILKQLRKNARQSLTNISTATKIPITTVYDRLQMHEKGLIKRHTCLINFSEIGFHGRAHILFKVKRENREELQNFLLAHKNVNSVYIVNHDFDLMADVVFRDLREIKNFIEKAQQDFDASAQMFHIIHELQKEAFLTK